MALKGLQTPHRLIRYTVEKASCVLVWSGNLHNLHYEQNDFEDARLQSHFKVAHLQNFQPLPSRITPLKPQKGKDANHQFPESQKTYRTL
jgi:hypothetical protein